MLPFLDREKELEFLERKWASGKPELLIIYGRRRIGKTALIKRFIEGKRAIYHLSTQDTFIMNMKTLKEKLEALGPKIDTIPSTLRDLFTIFKDVFKERTAFVIDEFPYLMDTKRSLLSDLQYTWDEVLPDTKIFLVLLGSSVSVMENDVLGARSPLYGRRTGQLKIGPLPLSTLPEVFSYGPRDLIKVWGVTGNVPFYLNLFDPAKTVEENIREAFGIGGILREEGFFLLREELREPRSYLAVLRAIGEGHTTLGAIANATGIPKQHLTKYLYTLEMLGMVERIVPYGKKRKGKYYISDNYMNLWIRIYPRLEALEEIDLKSLEPFWGEVYERFVLQAIREGLVELPFRPTYVGKWWSGEREVDVVAADDKNIFLAEVKWGKADRRLLRKLYNLAEEIAPNKNLYVAVFSGEECKGCITPGQIFKGIKIGDSGAPEGG